MIQFLSSDTRRDPFPLYESLRRLSPVTHDAESNTWMLVGYERVNFAINSSKYFSSSMYQAGRANPPWLIFFDPPKHTKLRALVTKAFTPAVISGLEPRIRQLSAELLDRCCPSGCMDLVIDYAVPLPLMVVSELLGIPPEDWPTCRAWSDSLLLLSCATSGSLEESVITEVRKTTAAMMTYLVRVLEQRRREPRPDLLTKLLEAEIDGEHLTAEDILGFFQLLLVAGHETTTNLINNAVICFLDNPDQLAKLRADRSLLPSAIEEVLRFRSPIQWLFRATTEVVDVDGVTIPARSLVLPLVGAANRDPAKFLHPERFNIERNPNPHIAFGHGIHFCLGAALSRLEARIAIGDILDRCSDLQYADSDP